jgi:CubicO group peptidase (beta-lactamase class C family)
MNRLARLILPAVAAAALASPSVSAPAPPSPSAVSARLDAVVAAYASEHRFMGAVLVIDGDRVLLDRGYEMANLDWDIPNAPDVKFRIGSLTKQFTAALVLLLQQDGKLSLSDTIGARLPDAPAAWSKITIAQLLHHTSGIPDFTHDPRFAVWSASPRTPKEIMALVAGKPLDFPTGGKFAYSNTNYEILGAIIEKVSGKTYGELLRSRLLDPLGLKDTGLDADDLILPRRALGYARDDAGGLTYARSESMTVPWAAGSMYSTTGDLARWDQALFGGKALSAASLAQMTTPGLGDYGLGLDIARHAGEPIIWHNGGIEGFHSYLAWLPQRRLIVVVLSNDEGPAEIIGARLIEVASGRPVILPTERQAVPIAPADLAKFVGAFTFPDEPAPVRFDIDNDRLAIGQHHRPLTYLGLRNGHPIFWDPARDYELEFTPDATGAMTTVTIQAGDQTEIGRKKPGV